MAEDPFIHPTAIVEDGVAIGDGTKVWHHCHLRAGAVIGRDVSLGQGVFVDVDVRVGDRVKAQNHVYLPQGITVEDDVFLGPKATFTNDVYPRAADDWAPPPPPPGRRPSVGAGRARGPYCDVGAGSVVTKRVEAFELVAGNPARRIGWVDSAGQVVARGDVPPPADCDSAGDSDG